MPYLSSTTHTYISILRFLHSKIFLFRPMLARLCFLRSENQTNLGSEGSLKDQVLQNCAKLCVENSQRMIDLVTMYYQPIDSVAVAVIPWWYRIFYLHSASIVLVAAKLRSGLFGPTVSETWNKAMATLQSQEHLSPYVSQCLSTFQMLSNKIAETRLSASGRPIQADTCMYLFWGLRSRYL
jgi:hypothetical protein